MEYKVKTAQTLNVSIETPGALSVPNEAVQMAEWSLESKVDLSPVVAGVDEFATFDSEYPTVAEVVEERLSFKRKRSWLFQRLAGATALATGVVAVSALTLVAVAGVSQGYRALSHGSGLIHSWDLKNEGWVDTTPEWMKEKPATDSCMLQAPPEEGGDCLH